MTRTAVPLRSGRRARPTCSVAAVAVALSVLAGACSAGNGDGVAEEATTSTLGSVPEPGELPITVRAVPPTEADPASSRYTGDHLVAVPAPEAARGSLLVWFPGTGARPDQYSTLLRRAAELGYHVIGLDYDNRKAINFDVCPGQPPGCPEAARLEILTGEESDYIEPDVDETNAAYHRLSMLLAYEQAQHPDERWDAYLDGGSPRWDRITVAGHSQGGGHAAMTAKLHEVERLVLFGATEPAAWTLEPFATPSERFWGLAHTEEPIFAGISRSWDNLALPGDLDEVSATPPTDGPHRLATTWPDCSGDPTSRGYHHNCYSVDEYLPATDAGDEPVFQPLWDYLLTT